MAYEKLYLANVKFFFQPFPDVNMNWNRVKRATSYEYQTVFFKLVLAILNFC